MSIYSSKKDKKIIEHKELAQKQKEVNLEKLLPAGERQVHRREEDYAE